MYNKLTRSFLTISLFLAAVTITSCNDSAEDGREFLENVSRYCGHAYEGRTTEFALGTGDDDHPLEDPRMLMILEKCSEDEIRIPFHVDDDTSRTWILQMRDGTLHLSHDHRYPDGTEYDQNMYGGYSDARSSSVKHFFPADEFTIAERPQREINVWSKEIDQENDKYYYRLYLDGDRSFEAAFDLGDPLPIP